MDVPAKHHEAGEESGRGGIVRKVAGSGLQTSRPAEMEYYSKRPCSHGQIPVRWYIWRPGLKM